MLHIEAPVTQDTKLEIRRPLLWGHKVVKTKDHHRSPCKANVSKNLCESIRMLTNLLESIRFPRNPVEWNLCDFVNIFFVAPSVPSFGPQIWDPQPRASTFGPPAWSPVSDTQPRAQIFVAIIEDCAP